MEPFKITTIKGNDKEIREDLVAEEVPLTIEIGEKELVTLLCSPFDLDDLVRGFLFTSPSPMRLPFLVGGSEAFSKIIQRLHLSVRLIINCSTPLSVLLALVLQER